jgi:hypothetical protein
VRHPLHEVCSGCGCCCVVLCVGHLHPRSSFALAGCICILRLCVARALLPWHVTFACRACVSRLRVCSCVVRFACHVCLFSFARGAYVSRSHVRACLAHLRVALTRHVRTLLIQTSAFFFYSTARKSHTTQTSTRSSFFTSKEKSCAWRVLTRGSSGSEANGNGKLEMLAADWKMLCLGGGNGDVAFNRERLCLAGCAARTHFQLQSERVLLATR